MWSAFTPGCMMRATAEIIHRAPNARLSGVSSAPRWVWSRLEPRLAIPTQRCQIISNRMDSNVAGNRAGAGDRGRRDIDLTPLQPLGTSHVVGVTPSRGKGPALSQGSGRMTQNFLPEFVEHQGTGKCLVVRERGDHVGFVTLRRAGKVLQQLAGPARPNRRDGCRRSHSGADAARRPAFQYGDRNAGGALDRRQHLTLRQRLKPRLHDLAQNGAEHRQIRRPGQAPRGGFEVRRW